MHPPSSGSPTKDYMHAQACGAASHVVCNRAYEITLEWDMTMLRWLLLCQAEHSGMAPHRKLTAPTNCYGYTQLLPDWNVAACGQRFISLSCSLARSGYLWMHIFALCDPNLGAGWCWLLERCGGLLVCVRFIWADMNGMRKHLYSLLNVVISMVNGECREFRILI